MQVRTDGLIRSHRDPDDVRCSGSSQPPVISHAPASHVAELDEAMSHRLRLAAAVQGITLTEALSRAIDCWLGDDFR